MTLYTLPGKSVNDAKVKWSLSDLDVHVGTEYFSCQSFQLLWQFRNYRDTKVYQNV